MAALTSANSMVSLLGMIGPSVGPVIVGARSTGSSAKTLFTPLKVSGGPSTAYAVGEFRVTRGIFVGSGRRFVLVDRWFWSATPQRCLGESWVGSTSFLTAERVVVEGQPRDCEEVLSNGKAVVDLNAVANQVRDGHV